MKEVNVIFPHQLFLDSPLPIRKVPTYLLEEYLFFNQYAFHKQKLAYHRATMSKYDQRLRDDECTIHYIDAQDPSSDIRTFVKKIAEEGVTKLHYIDPVDDWLSRRLTSSAQTHSIELVKYDSPMFLNKEKELQPFFRSDKKKYFQTKFYIEERKKRNILLEDEDKPLGGKWSFDTENRKKYPRSKTPPSIKRPDADNTWLDAVVWVEKHYPNNPGKLSTQPLYPADHDVAEQWLHQFLEERFEEFGDYEDAIVQDENILNHSVLTPMLNIGLITPSEVIDKALNYADRQGTRINSVEGFVRQIMGWREFIRGVYIAKGREERSKNYWEFDRKIPTSFYDGTTGIPPIDMTIQNVLKTGYCHHIERLMVLGNFMLLCEFDPDEVYRWFMELFIDAYDWVMVPNIYGMSQFADGGLMSTKPYISGSNYLMKMSDYPKGDWQKTWDGLFWRFMHVHRDFFTSNPRLGMLIRTWDRMNEEKKDNHLRNAEVYLERLDG